MSSGELAAAVRPYLVATQTTPKTAVDSPTAGQHGPSAGRLDGLVKRHAAAGGGTFPLGNHSHR